MFQHTAARRRLLEDIAIGFSGGWVSTHSRAEAAASFSLLLWFLIDVSTHSRAEAAALIEENAMNTVKVSTHSRAEAAAKASFKPMASAKVSTHSRAEAAAQTNPPILHPLRKFQHTAARRRLRTRESKGTMA